MKTSVDVWQYDLVGNRLHEARGQSGLDGYFNTLNQLTHLVFTGKVDVVGSVAATNGTVLVNGYAATMYNTSNYLGGVKLKPGSNTVNVVASYTGTTNRKEQVFAVFAPASNPQQFLWDANGCLTNDGYASYTWDNENRLKQIETCSAYTGLERRKTEFVYDAQSRMVLRTDYTNWTGSAYAATNTTRYIRDGYRVLAEIQTVGSQASTNYFCWGLDLSQSLDGAGGIGGLLARATAASNSTWLFTFDGNGNVADVLDGTGAVIAHYAYDPFGRVVEKTGSAATSNQWQFSTKLFDETWGLSLYEFRPYSPRLHIFLSPDPLGTRGGVNLYGFVGNRPIGRVDRLGLTEWPKAPDVSPLQWLGWEVVSIGNKTPVGFCARDPRWRGKWPIGVGDIDNLGSSLMPQRPCCTTGGEEGHRHVWKEPQTPGDLTVHIEIRADFESKVNEKGDLYRHTLAEHESLHAVYFAETVVEHYNAIVQIAEACVPARCDSQRDKYFDAKVTRIRYHLTAQDTRMEFEDVIPGDEPDYTGWKNIAVAQEAAYNNAMMREMSAAGEFVDCMTQSR